MLHFDLIIYIHLFSYFSAESLLPSAEIKYTKLRSNNNGAEQKVRVLRSYCFCVYLVAIGLAHFTYIFYLVESFEIPWMIVELSGIANGIWLHLFAFSAMFFTGNAVMKSLVVS